MRVYRYSSDESHPWGRLAVAVDERAPIDLVEAFEASGQEFRREEIQILLTLLWAGREVWDRVADVVAHTEIAPVDETKPNVRWRCPVDMMGSLRDFLSFEDHVRRGAARRNTTVPPYWYESPVYYKGNHRAYIGPDEVCAWPSYTNKLDFELELAMVVGKRGKNISAIAASDHIFGFTIFNDFSARDVQVKELTTWLGPAKSKDFANSFGPCIVTADEVGTEPDLAMTCRVNGEEWGRARSSDMHWPWADMIAHVSREETIEPGDVYGSGTPGGCCGLDLGRDLEPGDIVELEIEKIGTLRNTIGAQPP